MKLDIIVEIWNMAKDSLLASDREALAENLIGILIDHDYSPVDIKSAFREDHDIDTALKYHVEDAIEFEEDDEDSDYYTEYEDDEEDEEY